MEHQCSGTIKQNDDGSRSKRQTTNFKWYFDSMGINNEGKNRFRDTVYEMCSFNRCIVKRSPLSWWVNNNTFYKTISLQLRKKPVHRREKKMHIIISCKFRMHVPYYNVFLYQSCCLHLSWLLLLHCLYSHFHPVLMIQSHYMSTYYIILLLSHYYYY